ncbi:MAG: fumarylacetoacetate hydrolase family protein [Planctomycetes bacterium]|nr:fumarylacetoacetate hydrolase family protein [Planctomycetota bacterium]
MRLCRFEHEGKAQLGLYHDRQILPLTEAAPFYEERTHRKVAFPAGDDLVPFLPPDGPQFAAARELAAWFEGNLQGTDRLAVKASAVRLLAPIPRPNKLLLLAGNYASHIEEGGGVAVARAKTFPYFFMKPPTTTINHPEAPISIPAVSPRHIDWECELGVVIGKRAKGVSEAEALSHVGAYTVVNDISDRRFKPNPGREKRERDEFFDWLHGKWHDGFCPIGPCVLTADAVPDPQKFHLTLKVNGQVKQDASTALMIFPVAALVAFISSFVTLETGDLISTGTPSGVGAATGTYLKPGDRLEAAIDGIGVLRNIMA